MDKAEKKKTPLFTIVICTYNGENYLDQCLTAIIKLHSLREYVGAVLVVDNNSTDNTKNIILKYAETNDLIKYVFEERQGLSYAREHAVKAQTEWVIYVDDDNILDQDWLIQLEKVIREHPRAGVVNGAVIAKPINNLNEQKKAILKAMYKNLACTHIEEPKVSDAPNTIPMGAGMCVRTDALRRIEVDGWLNLTGRTKKDFSSGEDTELCERVFSQGYEYASSYKMKLYHLIPDGRLEEKYIVKLVDGLVRGRVDFLKNQRFGYIKCTLRKMKYQVLLQKYRKNLAKTSLNQEKYWNDKVQMYQAEAFLRILNK